MDVVDIDDTIVTTDITDVAVITGIDNPIITATKKYRTQSRPIAYWALPVNVSPACSSVKWPPHSATHRTMSRAVKRHGP